ncbi:MAG: hypothetical protein CVU39_10035 [Chloroflexi bacterium HGW-Chloroflexi-10]|nr:MAG: hypothetical protein CVU39_10035 [Chloroflexi bacterium HGW-Chloroflexi-10]
MNKSNGLFKLVVSLSMLAVFLATLQPIPRVQAEIGQSLADDALKSASIDSGKNIDNQHPEIAPGVVLIALKPEAKLQMNRQDLQIGDNSLASLFSGLGVQGIEPVFQESERSLSVSSANTVLDISNIYRLQLAPSVDVFHAVRELSANPVVAFAEPDYLAEIIAIPDDLHFSEQWGLTQINAPAAWDVVTGSEDVVIAVVDSGSDASHADLASQYWTNPGEIISNGLDDDNNGYIDDIQGWNFVDNDADLSDNTGHGTQVAGVIAASTNNGVGVAGVCWDCKLMIIKVVQSGGVANYSDIASGVLYAAQKGADVINLSLGGYSDSATLKAAIAAASQTAVVVGGAGNDTSSNAFYPAAYDDYVLAVAGTTSLDKKVDTSNFGTWVDVSAPGELISTTFNGGSYGSASGTSMAAPFVAGLAGLLRSQHQDWLPNQVRAHIIHTTDSIEGLNPDYAGSLGSGRINAGQAVTMPAQPELSISGYTVNGITAGTTAPGSAVNLMVTLRNNWGTATNVSATLSSVDPYVTIDNNTAAFDTINAYAVQQNPAAFVFSVSDTAPYAYTMQFLLTIVADGGFQVVLPLDINTQSGTMDVGGPIGSNTTWTNDKTYHVIDNILVGEGITLTIAPGTVVRFAAGKSLLISGTLIADALGGEEIIFTSDQQNPLPGSWKLIKFAETAVDATLDLDNEYLSGSIIRNARIEYGEGVALMVAMPYISNVTFFRNKGNNEGETSFPKSALWRRAWLNSRSGTLVVRDSLFLENEGAGFAMYQQAANTIVTGSKFIDNGSYSFYFAIDNSPVEITANHISGNGAGLFLETVTSSTGDILIQDNIFLGKNGPDHSGNGIWLDTASPTINHNLFAYHNFDVGSCDESCAVIYAHDQAAPTVTRNTFVYNNSNSLICFNCTGDYGLAGPMGVYQNNNWVNNTLSYVFVRRVSSASDITATNNYWGTTNPVHINQLIFDYFDDANPGVVFYQPFLTSPEPTAPAYLSNAVITPSPVGIEQVTFEFTFSAPMDQSINPTVTFGTVSPFTSYIVSDNAQWLTEFVWQATFDITSLVPVGTYTVSVGDAKGADGMTVPIDTLFGFTVGYGGTITDQTPPPAPRVWASGITGVPSSVEATWHTNDPDSEITGYRYAIGSAPGAADIVNWTSTTSTTLMKSSLGLVEGRQYWVIVQARNVGGLWSASGYGGFVAGEETSYTIFLPLLLK